VTGKMLTFWLLSYWHFGSITNGIWACQKSLQQLLMIPSVSSDYHCFVHSVV